MAGRFVGVLIVVVTLAACGPKVIVDYDDTIDFTRYRTYAWGQGTPAKNPLMDRRIVTALEEQLANKGYQKVETDPDMFVSYHVALTQDIEYNTTSMGYGYGPGWGYGRYGGGGAVGVGVSSARPTRVTNGSIVVDIYDAKDKRMIWRGSGSDTVLPDPEETEAQIREGAEKMFKKFPPPTK